jgi:monoamine oxidase
VLGSLNFQYYEEGPGANWYCIEGGAQELAVWMQKRLVTKPSYKSRVIAVKEQIGEKKISVEVEGKGSEDYDAVFSSVPLGCLKRIDTRGVNLNYSTKQAIRTLSYSPAAKAAIKFKRAWWIHDLGDQYNRKKAGLGHSDLSIRTCVYPSYNIHDAVSETAVLLCSYTWQQDALRMGSLTSNSSDPKQKLEAEKELKERLFRDLARLHAGGSADDQQPAY